MRGSKRKCFWRPACEPLNYIDLFSRVQIEELLLQYQPTLLFVEHDRVFQKKIATQVVEL